MRSYQNGVGLCSNVTGVLIRRGKFGLSNRDTQKGEHHVKTQTLKESQSRGDGVGTEVTGAQVGERRGLPAVISCKRGMEESLPQGPPEEPVLATPGLQTSNLHNCGRIKCCGFQPPSLWSFGNLMPTRRRISVWALLCLRTFLDLHVGSSSSNCIYKSRFMLYKAIHYTLLKYFM